ncbi:peptide ABC transporter ATP-binding protein [Desulfoluna limicola]|uniref:Nickel import system ATP-binding protein NikD n=1 Tax=Desulfoluna limicola TaxID=2810562 RepID=A0ABM7PJT8_9BACT|nr:ABC transporter ATP-binding protein [Desulfoluna limicola]BCS97461.1 peptide ABC transporter ATP-binding protein [Desulfoluna limicola]
MGKIIEAIDLTTHFYTYEGVVKALDKVCISVDHGTTFGLVGESGCGKSVTVRSMMRIIQEPGRIEGGKVLFFPTEGANEKAVDLLSKSEAWMQTLRGDRISMIFQEPNAALNPIMRVGDQVAESFIFHRKRSMSKKILEDLGHPETRVFPGTRRLQKALYAIASQTPNALSLRISRKIPLLRRWEKRIKREAFRRATEIIGHLGIAHPEEVARSYPHNLSGGMKQRIVIAIALACKPDLLIADEATSNLDVTVQAQILDLLKELKKTEISSILMITHDLGVVAETCDRVGVMYAGTLCEEADVKELFTDPKHPYTVALLASVPRFHQEGELKTIEGVVPNLVHPPSGCRFHPRCAHVMKRCKVEVPELINVGEKHKVACHLYDSKGESDA